MLLFTPEKLHLRFFFYFACFCRRIELLVFLLLFAGKVHGEGSKELNANGGQRAYLISTTTSSQGIYFPTQGQVRVYVNQGETIYLGSSAQGVYGGKTILVSPSGLYSVTNSLTDGTGFIKNVADEVAGPIGPGGFTPFKHTAEESGIWTVFFTGSTSNINAYDDPIDSDDNWSRTSDNAAGNKGDNSGDIAAFDVSVSASANATSSSDFIKGRAYMNVFAGNLGNYAGRFYGVFQVLTNDGYKYSVDANGLAGYRFTFFSNNKGYKNAGGAASYLSENSTSTTNLKDPRTTDTFNAGGTANDVTHKLFFQHSSWRPSRKRFNSFK